MRKRIPLPNKVDVKVDAKVDAKVDTVLFAKSVDYALRALNHIARNTSASQCRATGIATELGTPVAYTAKILQILTLSGVLVSTRGRKGGFSLTARGWSITIGQLIIVLQGKVELPSWLGRSLIAKVKEKLKEQVVVMERKTGEEKP